MELLEQEVNVELEKVYNWLCSNKLTLNISKSKCMIITRKRNILPMSIKIDNIELEQCQSYKYLGVIFDKDLSWKQHIEHICGKITKTVSSLALLRHRTSISVLREVFYALINSYLKYGIIVWGNAAEIILHPLKVLVNKAIRIMTFAPFGPIDLKPIYKELELLDLDQLFLLEQAKFMYKKKKALLPTTIANYFEPETRPEHNYNLRRRQNENSNFRSKLAIGKKSIQNRGETVWKKMPQYLKDCDTLIMFKKYYKSYLLAQSE